MAAAVTALAACSNDDFVASPSDEAQVITFRMGTETPVSKATYRSWETGDPDNFGVFAYYNQNMTTPLFDNQQVNRVSDAWTYTHEKYWADYSWCSEFDFFAYMPHMAADNGVAPRNGVKLDKDGDDYTISFPVSLLADIDSDGEVDDSAAIIDDVSRTPLICALPIHKTVVGDVISYNMDQTLTAFDLKFVLGDKMSSLRDFIIKEVRIKGAAGVLPIKGVVSRTYTRSSSGNWKAETPRWESIGRSTAAIDQPLAFYDHGDGAEGDAYDASASTLRIGYSFQGDTCQWGKRFYAIPSEHFTPTISVTYDVVVKDEGGNDIVTRPNITSTILFSDEYFAGYSAGEVGKVYPIVIQIVPSYLYVLADADQRVGYLVVGD